MSTRGGVSAFGVVHKSEYAPGKFKPVTEMGPKKRLKTFETIINRGIERHPVLATPANRGLGDAYALHGAGMRNFNASGVASRSKSTAKLKREFNPIHHTPSAVHPNIAYGESTSPKARARLDRKIDSGMAGKLKHPVVFHQDKKMFPGAHAAALPAHQLTGNKGHVVLGHSFKRSGKWMGKMPGSKATERGVLNHELSHASVKGRPVTGVMDAKKAKSALGEEGRADVMSRGHVYTRTGAIQSRKTLKATRKMLKNPTQEHRDEWKALGVDPTPKDLKTGLKAMEPHRHYHRVKGIIRAAAKLR